MRFARHPSFRESSSCFDDVGLSFHPRNVRKITSSTCISFSLFPSLFPQVKHGVRWWSSFDELFRRVDHEDTRNGDQGYQAHILSRPLDIYPSFHTCRTWKSRRLESTPIIRIPYLAIFPGIVPSTLPSSPPFRSLPFPWERKRVLRPPTPHQATSLPKTTAFTYVTRVSKRALTAGLKETSPHDGVFRLVASSHSELDKHACSQPARFLDVEETTFFFPETSRASSAIPPRCPDRLNNVNHHPWLRSVSCNFESADADS